MPLLDANPELIPDCRLLGLLSVSLALTACGGSSGSGGGNPVSPSDPINSNDTPAPITAEPLAACTDTLDNFLSNLASPSGLISIPNISNGCDYLVDDSTSLTRDVTIDAGVTFAMAPGARLEFRGTNTAVNGTSNSPVRFVSNDENAAWDYVNFGRSNTIITYSLFSGGGAATGPFNREPAMVYSNGDESTITNSSFSNSVSAGLSMINPSGSAQVLVFAGNSFNANAHTGLVTDGGAMASLDTGSDYDGANQPNGTPGVRISNQLISRQWVRNINTDYVFDPEFTSSGLGISSTIVDPGVAFVVPDDLDVTVTDANLNGTADDPVLFKSTDSSASGWGALVLTDATVRNIILENGGSANSPVGASLSIRELDSLDRSLENITIRGSNSWGVICDNATSSTVSGQLAIDGLEISDSSFGDLHPTCTVAINPAVVDGERTDPRACNQVLGLDPIELQSIAVLSNSTAECDYYVVGNVRLSGASGAITIQDGTSLLFARNASLSVNGSLIARGTQASPISFKAEVQNDGYWQGLSTAGLETEFSHVSIEDGGTVISPALLIEFPNSTSSEADVATTLTEVSVTGSLGDGLVLNRNIAITEFTANKLFGNAGYGTTVPLDSIDQLSSDSLFDSAMAPNGNPGIRLTIGSAQSTTLREGTYTFNDVGAPWAVPGIRLTNGSNGNRVTMNFNPGVTMHFDKNASFDIGRFVNSAISDTLFPQVNITGTSNNPVVFSGPSDDPSAWNGLAAGPSEVNINFAEIIGGGDGDDESDNSITSGGALTLLPSATIDLSNTRIESSRAWGITCPRTGAITVSQSVIEFENNTLGDIDPDCNF